MYLDNTANRVQQHRAAMEKHAGAARQAKLARQAISPAYKAAPATRRHGNWSIPAWARPSRPARQPAPRPVTV